MKKILTILATSIVFLLGSISAIYIEEIPFDVSAILSVVFTGVAALATAYAALSASRSARVAEQSASIWKKQMRLDVELSEAKKLKIALNAWHRHFIHEAEKYSGEDLLRIGELLQIQNKEVSINHLHKYISKYEELWGNLDQSFDNASFIVNDFEERLRLRRLSYTHLKGCYELMSYLQGITEPGPNFFEINCSAVYRASDWHQLDLAGIQITRIKLEQRDANGKLVTIKNENDEFIYTSVCDDVQSWYTQIGIKIDSQIETIKFKLDNI
ncbi:TPA: hypothetical protein ACX6RA_000140 [Photobacterium damselae]